MMNDDKHGGISVPGNALAALEAVIEAVLSGDVAETQAARASNEAARGMLPRRFLAEHRAAVERMEQQIRLVKLKEIADRVAKLFKNHGVQMRVERVVKARQKKNKSAQSAPAPIELGSEPSPEGPPPPMVGRNQA